MGERFLVIVLCFSFLGSSAIASDKKKECFPSTKPSVTQAALPPNPWAGWRASNMLSFKEEILTQIIRGRSEQRRGESAFDGMSQSAKGAQTASALERVIHELTIEELETNLRQVDAAIALSENSGDKASLEFLIKARRELSQGIDYHQSQARESSQSAEDLGVIAERALELDKDLETTKPDSLATPRKMFSAIEDGAANSNFDSSEVTNLQSPPSLPPSGDEMLTQANAAVAAAILTRDPQKVRDALASRLAKLKAKGIKPESVGVSSEETAEQLIANHQDALQKSGISAQDLVAGGGARQRDINLSSQESEREILALRERMLGRSLASLDPPEEDHQLRASGVLGSTSASLFDRVREALGNFAEK